MPSDLNSPVHVQRNVTMQQNTPKHFQLQSPNNAYMQVQTNAPMHLQQNAAMHMQAEVPMHLQQQNAPVHIQTNAVPVCLQQDIPMPLRSYGYEYNPTTSQNQMLVDCFPPSGQSPARMQVSPNLHTQYAATNNHVQNIHRHTPVNVPNFKQTGNMDRNDVRSRVANEFIECEDIGSETSEYGFAVASPRPVYGAAKPIIATNISAFRPIDAVAGATYVNQGMAIGTSPAITRPSVQPIAPTPVYATPKRLFAHGTQTSLEYVPQMTQNPQEFDTNIALAGIYRDTLPRAELPIFEGEILNYPEWKIAFQHHIGSKVNTWADKLFYLQQYTAKTPRRIVTSCLYGKDHRNNYLKAWTRLDRRYEN